MYEDPHFRTSIEINSSFVLSRCYSGPRWTRIKFFQKILVQTYNTKFCRIALVDWKKKCRWTDWNDSSVMSAQAVVFWVVTPYSTLDETLRAESVYFFETLIFTCSTIPYVITTQKSTTSTAILCTSSADQRRMLFSVLYILPWIMW